MNPEHSTSLSDHMFFSALIVYGLQAAKKARWLPWINADTGKLNQAISIVGAFIAALGISVGLEGNFESGGHILLSFPPATQMFDLARHWAAQWALNQILYKTAVAPPAPVEK